MRVGPSVCWDDRQRSSNRVLLDQLLEGTTLTYFPSDCRHFHHHNDLTTHHHHHHQMVRTHHIGDHVYIRDHHYEWLPAIVLDVKGHEVLVRVVRPSDWKTTTILRPDNDHDDDEPRWEPLVNYANHHLPIRDHDHDDNHNSSNDLSQLRYIHEAALLYHIKQRHVRFHQPYTRITTDMKSTMMMVAVNPGRYIPSWYTIEKQQYYINRISTTTTTALIKSQDDPVHAPSFDEKKEDDPFPAATGTTTHPTLVGDVECEPHIYEISSLAYHGLLSPPYQNQTIWVSGESGSGKTESIKIVLKHLASLTPPPPATMVTPITTTTSLTPFLDHGNDELVSHILASSPIFEAFGNAKTRRNANSSRLGKVTQLQYAISTSTQGEALDTTTTAGSAAYLVGSSFQTYMFEANRVVSHVHGERNYHIFYQMLSAPAPVKQELLGPDWKEATPADFSYLHRSSGGLKDNMIDASNWTYTLKALIVFGWDGDSLEQLMRALGIILLIGNMEFQEMDHHKASIAQPADLIMLSTSLGIHASELELALTQRTIQTTHDLLLVPLTPEQANEACEALSKTIYSRIFAAVVQQINHRTASPASRVTGTTIKTIALVDIFGFETFEVNRFEQFCINYANERLQQKYILDNLHHHKIELEAEGIALPEWKNIDNSSTVELFESVPGLIQSLNDQCILPNGSSEDYVSIVKQLHQGHENIICDKLQTSTVFGVYHFAGPVVYDASQFVERNTDKLPDFLISVMATSTNGLIAQELGEIMKERSCAARSTKKSLKRSVIDVFQHQLKELMSSIDASQPRYIRCIKPCDDLETLGKVDHHVVLRQLKCSGLVTALKLSRNIFPDKLSFETIATRYSCLLSSNAMASIEDMDLIDKTQVILSSVYAPFIEQYNGSTFDMPFACGLTKVFFRVGALAILEKQQYSLQSRSAVKVQSVVRSCIARRRTIRVRFGFTHLQSICRGRVVCREFRLLRRAAIKVQAMERLLICERKFLKIKASIMILQKWWIRIKVQLEARRKVCRFKEKSALIINRWICGLILNRQRQKKNDCILLLTAWLRSRNQRASFVRAKISATTIAAQFRCIRIRKHYYNLKKASNIIARLWLKERTNRLKSLNESEMRQTLVKQEYAVRKIQSFCRLMLKAKSRHVATNVIEAPGIVPSCGNEGNSLPTCNCSHVSLPAVNGEHLLITSQSIFEQVEIYRRQIADLKSDITLLTSEAELHKQELEAEFEDRLAEYENEVLELKQAIKTLKNEKVALSDENAANIDSVQNMKQGIQSMHEAHREYLHKVMRAVENANREHQIALELIQRDKEQQIKELSDEVVRLQSERQECPERGADSRNSTDRIYQIARKIEKVTSPDCIVALAKKVRKVNSKEEYVEEKFSGRIRQLLYKLEDIAALAPGHKTCEEEYVISLQQQLINAKAEIDRLNDHIRSFVRSEASVGRLGLKKFFER